jgi:CRP-like cAMP-binding protein
METTIKEAFCSHFSRLAQELGPELTVQFLSGVTELALPANRKLIRARMPVDSLYFIVHGAVTVTADDGSSSKILGVLGPGQCFGEVSVLSGERMASASVTTQNWSRFLRMRHSVLEDFISNQHTVASVFLPYLVLMLSERLRGSFDSNPVDTVVES